MKTPPHRKRVRRKQTDRQAESLTRLDLSASLVVAPFTGTFLTQIPVAPATAATLTPVRLTMGDPPAFQVDLEAVFAKAVQFIGEHPVLCTTIAAGVIFVIWACHQPPRPASSRWS
jgi:hypothetical protein